MNMPMNDRLVETIFLIPLNFINLNHYAIRYIHKTNDRRTEIERIAASKSKNSKHDYRINKRDGGGPHMFSTRDPLRLFL